MSLKQILFLVGVVVMMGGLLSLDIKKAGRAPGGPSKPVTQPQANVPSIDVFDSVITAEKKSLQPDQLTQVNLADKTGPASTDSATDKKLASLWDRFNKANIKSYYEYLLAKNHPTVRSWMNAGNSFRNLIAASSDSRLLTLYVQLAENAYASVLALDSSQLDAKSGLGVVYVTASQEPMKGIALLKEVVTKHPDNYYANFNLGLFDMKSGQFEKAIPRFLKISKLRPSGEVFFYLGQAYQSLKKNAEAREAYQNSKKYMDDPNDAASVDRLINELK